jgi:hypothetical protein
VGNSTLGAATELDLRIIRTALAAGLAVKIVD